MYIEKLTDEEIKEIVEPIVEKYNLRKNALNSSYFKIRRHHGAYEILIAKYVNEHGPVTTHEINIWISDFEVHADLYEENEKSAVREYRKSMLTKFGIGYKYNLNRFLYERKQSILKVQEQELDDEITEVMQELN